MINLTTVTDTNESRRKILVAFGVCLLSLAGLGVGDGSLSLYVEAVSAFAYAQEVQARRALRILIAFFSHTNNTRAVAEEIQRQVGGDLFHITTKTPYPANYQQTVQMVRNERERNSRSELATTVPVEVMQQYDVLFLGYPNWCMTMPMAAHTFLDQYDLSGKYIVPFCTHEGSGISNATNELRERFPQANVLQGLAVNGRMASRAQNDVTGWLRTHGFIR